MASFSATSGRHISAFNILAAQVRKEMNDRGQTATLGDVSKATAERWRVMTEYDRRALAHQVDVEKVWSSFFFWGGGGGGVC